MSKHFLEQESGTIISGEIKRIDHSFSHAFGVKKQYSYEVENLSVIAWVEGFETDVVSSLSDGAKQYFSSKLINDYFQ
jgi:hypothetical protein